jgi:ADP-ribose pyrophosphatase
MKRYNDSSFPPLGEWDRRLSEVACPDLAPVELLHENEWFAVRNRGGYYTMEHHLQQVIVLPVVEQRAVVMIRAKRPVLADSTLELPAGCTEDGEAPEAGAARELAEETGISVQASRMVPMPPLAGSPNRIPSLLYVFRVELTQAEFERRGMHDSEVEGVELVAFDEVVRRISRGAIYVAVPIAVISTYLLNRAK